MIQKTGPGQAKRLLLADHEKMLREGLNDRLSSEVGLRIVGQAGNGFEAVAQAVALKPTLVIIEPMLPQMNGIEASSQILKKVPGTWIIALAMHATDKMVLDMFSAGALAFLTKDSSIDELIHAIEEVSNRGLYIGSKIKSPQLISKIREGKTLDKNNANELSSRQREVLQLLAEGYTTQQIATKLFLSVKTVETHRSHLMDKLGIHSIALLTKYAIREGITLLNN